MATEAMRIDNLGKRYWLHGHAGLDETLPEYLTRQAKRWCGLEKRQRAAGEDRSFWALRDVSLTVATGEVLGIVGRNGAGKSTLLKILSGITDPTEGRARIQGRVASLLEVGTGFHPELTGRENIFLNGSILGMTRAEIRRQFDAIVDFSGVERFLETPVKRYSSGMAVRLAFAVAAHLEPEILIIDEVLAVGDAQFQSRCLGKMNEVAHSGRTVLFVSHNLAAVQSLCSRAVLLDAGRLTMDGLPADVVAAYLGTQRDLATVSLAERTDRGGEGGAKLLTCRIESATPGAALASADQPLSHDPAPAVRVGQPWRVMLDYELGDPDRRYRVNVGVFDARQQRVAFVSTDQHHHAPERWPARGTLTVDLPDACTLWPGTYTVNVALGHEGRICDFVRDAASFEVVLAEDSRVDAPGRFPATLLLPARFSVLPARSLAADDRPVRSPVQAGADRATLQEAA